MSAIDARPAASIGVLIVDDQALVRAGFRMILEIEPDLHVVGEAADGDQAVAQVAALGPDVVLMDVRMPRADGIAATRRLMADASCGARVVMLTTFDMDEYVYEALKAGASGFLLKDVQPELLVAGIRAVHAGESLLAPTVTRRMIESFLDRPRAVDAGARERLASLTARERETLQLRGARADQRGDRGRSVCVRDHREDTRRSGADEARPARPGAGRDLRVRNRRGEQRTQLMQANVRGQLGPEVQVIECPRKRYAADCAGRESSIFRTGSSSQHPSR